MWHKQAVDQRHPFWTAKRLRRAGAFGVVLTAHLIVFALIARSQPPTPASLRPSPIDIILMRPPAPPPPPPPPPPAKISPKAGGGAPAAPSRVHRSPLPVEQPELATPPKPAPTPTLNVGVSDIASPTPGMGQGGQGTGTGAGTGEGDGPGAGMTPPRFIRGPNQGNLRDSHPREALRAGRSGVAVVNCRIQADTRLSRCRIVSETPTGQGFGAAGLSVAETYYRFQPPTRNGAPVEDQGVTVTIQFGRAQSPRG